MMLFDSLRSETSELHKEAEALNPLLLPDFTKERYLHYLQKLHPYFIGVEQQIRIHAEPWKKALMLEEREKSKWIADDLFHLGAKNTPKIEDISIGIDRLRNLSEVIGAMYVLEGSTLGGQIIGQKLKSNLNLTDDQLHFFRGHGDRTGAMWVAFKSEVTKLKDLLLEESVCLSAKNVFKDYIQLFRGI